MNESREWVVLIRTDKGYKQLGPFNTKNVSERIQSGEIRYSDHVWKAGFTSWARLGDLTDFGATPREEAAKEESQSGFVEASLDAVIQQVKLDPDFSLLPPREEEIELSMVKGLPIREADGSPVGFVETPLKATKRLHYRLRTPKLNVRGLVTAAVVFVALGGVTWLAKSLYESRPVTPKFSVGQPPPRIEVPQKPLEALQIEPVLADPNQAAVDAQRLKDLAYALAMKESLLEESHASLRSDTGAWDLYFSDWVRSLDREPFQSLREPGFAAAFDAAYKNHASVLQGLFERLLKRSETLNRSLRAEPSGLKSDIQIFIESLEAGN